MGEPGSHGTHSLGAIRAKLDQQIPHLYRDLALYLQVLREVLPASLDQACAYMASQVYPRRYTRLHPLARRHLHSRLKSLLRICCSFLTVEQLLNLASQITRERHRVALREHAQFLRNLEDEAEGASTDQDAEQARSEDLGGLPTGSIQLNLTPPLSWAGFRLPFPAAPSPDAAGQDAEGEMAIPSALRSLQVELLSALEDPPIDLEPPWSDGQLPRDPMPLIHCLECVDSALARRLRNLSHSVNVELMRAGLAAGLVPVSVLDAVISGQIEPQGAPPNVLRLPFLPTPNALSRQAPVGILLRSVDLEMAEPRLRTCRRRLLHHRQEILKMAETAHRLQRRLQAHHAERLWRHDSQLNPPKEI